MLKAIFEVKGEKKEVNVNFFTKDYTFLNHLKRQTNTQIKGSIQKVTILHLINKGNFTVISQEDGILFEGTESLKSSITYTDADRETIENITKHFLSIDEICYRLDELENESVALHGRLQTLFTIESKQLEEKLTA